ncbi:hypothetical protein D8I35_03305 [Corticibacter populi]|uniref:Type II/III secretion system secretin-like domain-containing protein n=1 Tax=Corticibacter populi TaxID=1550736 RepID=A0A3M6QYR2_9BURK|nr:hypothetical protein [Corticibacter populi]RMX08157.1 hypothetical protein D8I35_03305 [Corticibacter populi]RZS35418.1 type IVB pilus formation R64 PilN family outer membrane protein [Corticibacter populi]
MTAPRKTLTALVVTAMLSGCASTVSHQADADYERGAAVSAGVSNDLAQRVDDSTHGSKAHTDALAAQQASPAVTRRASRPWIGARFAEVQSDEVLPPVFYEDFSLRFEDVATGGRVPLAVVAERLTRITGVPVRINPDVYELPGGRQDASAVAQRSSVVARANQPAGALPAPLAGIDADLDVDATAFALSNATAAAHAVTSLSAIEMRFDGPLQVFVESLSNRLGLSTSFREGVLYFQRYVTETFELATFGGSQDYQMSLSGGTESGASSSESGASTTSNSTFEVSERGSVEAFGSFFKALEGMLQTAPGSTVSVNQGTGRFAVTTTKDVMSRVRQIAKAENEALQRQVRIQFDIYSVTSTRGDQLGIDWNAVINSLSSKWNATIASPTSLASDAAGSVGLSILSLDAGGNPNSGTVARWGGSSAVIQALNEVGSSVQHRPLEMLALNRQWARKTNLNDRYYVSETTPSVSGLGGGSASVGMKTDNVTTGDKFVVQPAILDNGTVLLKFGVSLTNLVDMFEVTAGSGETLQRVQNPEVSGTDDQATVRLKAGQVLVLTGMGRYKSSSNDRRLAEGLSLLAGGSRSAAREREEFLIVVRPVITQ